MSDEECFECEFVRNNYKLLQDRYDKLVAQHTEALKQNITYEHQVAGLLRDLDAGREALANAKQALSDACKDLETKQEMSEFLTDERLVAKDAELEIMQVEIARLSSAIETQKSCFDDLSTVFSSTSEELKSTKEALAKAKALADSKDSSAAELRRAHVAERVALTTQVVNLTCMDVLFGRHHSLVQAYKDV